MTIHYHHPRLASLCHKLHSHATAEAENLLKRELAKEIYNNSKYTVPQGDLTAETRGLRKLKYKIQNPLSYTSPTCRLKSSLPDWLRIFFTSTCCPATPASLPLPYGPSAYAQRTQEESRGRRWMPLSVSFTLINLLPLSNCSVLSVWIRLSRLSPDRHLSSSL